MNPREKGFLLLSSHLGNPDRKPLTVPQLRTLAQRIRSSETSREDRELEEMDLVLLGYGREMAQRILSLLEDTELLEHYLHSGRKQGCIPITRVSEGYPQQLHEKLGLDAPGCLWAKGDTSLLKLPGIALVGSRELEEANAAFAREVGRQAAGMGCALISGNARGADRAAQDACLGAGGKVISIVADSLVKYRENPNMLYISEDGFDEPFSAPRAHSRNRCIHTLGRIVFVAQSGLGKGGTWSGTVKNLQQGWTTVACFRDGSEAAKELEQIGAYLVDLNDIRDFSTEPQEPICFF